MERPAELIAIISSIIGALEISYVESRIIAKKDRSFSEKSLMTKYWDLLSISERCLFWTGMPMLAAPFILAFLG